MCACDPSPRDPSITRGPGRRPLPPTPEWIDTFSRSSDTQLMRPPARSPATGAPSAVTHLNRWKLATVLLAVATAVATVKAVTAGDRATGRAKPTVAATTSRASLPSNLRRPLRVSAAAVGISERDL